MPFAPTPEQVAALDAFRTGQDTILEAGAGTGKTSTLEVMARGDRTRRGTYMAYNKAAADEAGARFPAETRCLTAHSLGYRAVAAEWGGRLLQQRLNAPRRAPYDNVRFLGVDKLVVADGVILAPHQVVRIAVETVKWFLYSDATEPAAHHVPQVNGVTPDLVPTLRRAILPIARKVWADYQRPDGILNFPHDAYLKLFALTDPKLEGDYLFLDEAQDSNGVTASIFNNQDHLQRIAVGDRYQTLYAWRGAVDAMSTLDAAHHLQLTQSFRFGPAIAHEANKWLMLLGADLRIKGTPTIKSTLAVLDRPRAVLCRSNAEAVSTLMTMLKAGVKTAVVGGGGDIKRLAEASIELREKGRTNNPELCAFTSWGAVQDYVTQDAAGGDLKVAVTLIDDHGAETIIEALDATTAESRAQVVVSTAHKSKGREWDSVRIADDFTPPTKQGSEDTPIPAPADMMLAYVAVTRAKQQLDRSGLEWIDNYLAGGIYAGKVA